MTWTGLPGPTTAPSTSPARPALPRPAATSARGLASGVKADRFASWQDRSEVRTCAAADATCRSTSPGSAASITSGVSSRSAARANSDPPQSSRPSLMPYLSWRDLSWLVAGASGLFHEQHRDVVAHRVGQPALLVGAHQLAGVIIDPQRRVAFGQARISSSQPSICIRSPLFLAACGGGPDLWPSTSSRRAAMAGSVAASTFSRSSGSVLDGRTLNHQPPAGDGEPVELVGAHPGPGREGLLDPRGRLGLVGAPRS